MTTLSKGRKIRRKSTIDLDLKTAKRKGRKIGIYQNSTRKKIKKKSITKTNKEVEVETKKEKEEIEKIQIEKNQGIRI